MTSSRRKRAHSAINASRNQTGSGQSRQRSIRAYFADLLAISLLLALCVGVLVAAFPCGKHAHPVAGYCSSGQPFLSPLYWFLGTLIVCLLLGPLVFGRPSRYDGLGVGLFTLLRRDAARGIAKGLRPRRLRAWWRFLVAYGLIAAIAWFTTRGGGLGWLNYVALYGVAVPFLAAPLATFIKRKIL